MIRPTCIAAVIAMGLVPTLAHNFVVCSNSYPLLDDLLTTRNRWEVDMTGKCKGYPRAFPAEDSPEMKLYNDQGWPWQGIWPLHDQAALKNHRVCNWAQENPVYEQSHPPAKVKPGSSVLVQVQTNQHTHEFKDRPSGHYKIFLAGPSGTQLTTQNQLTFDRVVFSAPANKYAHIWGDPTSGAQDPGFAWLPLKLVDPTGEALPEGTYNFVFTYWWATAGNKEKNEPQLDYMIPDYSSSFDIIISSDSDADPGAITDCVTKTPKECATYLVGKATSPGAKDTTDPWPPYSNDYLYTNFDGDDPSTENGKRTFQPFWTDFVPATQAPKISTAAPKNVKQRSDEELGKVMPIAEGVDMPGWIDAGYTNMTAGHGEGLPITQRVEAKSLAELESTKGATVSGGDSGEGQEAASTMKKVRRHARWLQGSHA